MPKKVTVRDTIDEKEFNSVADMIFTEWKARKKRRKDSGRESQWDDVDRQLRMEPELSHKSDTKGKIVKGREWMPEVELPLQAQSLEMLTSDIRRLLFPNNRPSFSARAALTEKYLSRFLKAGSPFPRRDRIE